MPGIITNQKASKKKTKKRNPHIEKVEKEFYNKGCLFGFEQGVEVSKLAAEILFTQKMESLKQVKGIGPKTYDILVKHFEDFLKEVPDDEYNKIISNAKSS